MQQDVIHSIKLSDGQQSAAILCADNEGVLILGAVQALYLYQ